LGPPPGPPDEAWPVGSVFIAVVPTDPATLLGYGTWAAFAAGRVLVGLDSEQTEFDTVEETGGAKAVSLTGAQSGLPQHTHVQDAHQHGLQRYPTTTGGSSGFTADMSMSGTPAAITLPMASATATNQATGPTDAAQAHDNLPPYVVVHMWKRTA
jgi:microcystin-dependent protein